MPVDITLADGSKIVGADAEEALKNAVKQIEDTKAAYREINGKFETLTETVTGLQNAEQQRQAAAERERLAAAAKAHKDQTGFDNNHYVKLLNEDPLAAIEYANNYWLEKNFGAKPEEIKNQLTYNSQQVSKLMQESVAASFYAMHQDFPVGDAAAAKALNVAVTQLTNSGYPFDVTTLDFAYQSLVRDGKIKPLENKNDQTTEGEKPNPNLNNASGSGGQTGNEVDWEKLPDDQLKAELIKAGMRF
jgi:hypothetical protein